MNGAITGATKYADKYAPMSAPSRASCRAKPRRQPRTISNKIKTMAKEMNASCHNGEPAMDGEGGFIFRERSHAGAEHDRTKPAPPSLPPSALRVAKRTDHVGRARR